MQLLPGFRDLFPDDCARRNYILSRWRSVALRYGFVEYDGPVLESTELYRKKSGGELVGQLFDFVDKGGRDVALRPEMTPTLARMVIARGRDFRKPLKWFSVSQFFRYEKQQRGRLREFYQLNCDIIGEPSLAADAEVVALVIDALREFGLTAEDFVVRISDRDAWISFLKAKGIDAETKGGQFLQIIDKLERDSPESTGLKLKEFGLTTDEVREFIAHPGAHFERFDQLAADLGARGMEGFYKLDPAIVRGLAYYTGLVFEVFDRNGKLRALAGGGRYDNLLRDMSDGAVNMPALGFGMGDVVLGELIAETPRALESRDRWHQSAAEIYVVIAKEERRNDALRSIQQMREKGFRVDYPLSPAKVGKQFQTAEHLGARLAVLFGDEWPEVKIKTLATREEISIPHTELMEVLRRLSK